jgi:hypothetical protein
LHVELCYMETTKIITQINCWGPVVSSYQCPFFNDDEWVQKQSFAIYFTVLLAWIKCFMLRTIP